MNDMSHAKVAVRYPQKDKSLKLVAWLEAGYSWQTAEKRRLRTDDTTLAFGVMLHRQNHVAPPIVDFFGLVTYYQSKQNLKGISLRATGHP